MTVNDLVPLVRADLGRRPFALEGAVDALGPLTDSEAASSPSGAPSADDLADRVLDARDAVLDLVQAQHVPGCVRRFTGAYPYPAGDALPSDVRRVLPSRVYEARVLDEGEPTPYTSVVEGATTYWPCLRVAMEQVVRRGVRKGVFAVEGGRLCVPGGNALFDAVAPPDFVDRDTDIGLDERFERAVVQHVVASVWATRGEGRAVGAWNAFYRAVRPYARDPEAMEAEWEARAE